MQRTLLNLLINLASGLLFCAMIATGYLLRFPLPPGTNKALSLWGLTRHQWGEVHFWISTALVSVLVVHVILHWQWLVTVIRQRLHRAKSNSSKAGWITGLIVVGLFALFAWAAQVSVRERSDPCCDGADSWITGLIVVGLFALFAWAAQVSVRERSDPCCDGADKSNVKTSADDPKSNPPAAASWADVFPILEILERSCISCHGPKKAKGDFRIDRKDDYLVLRDGRALLMPGAPDQSPLLQIVSGARTDIPYPERHRLPTADVAILRAWISAGSQFEP